MLTLTRKRSALLLWPRPPRGSNLKMSETAGYAVEAMHFGELDRTKDSAFNAQCRAANRIASLVARRWMCLWQLQVRRWLPLAELNGYCENREINVRQPASSSPGSAAEAFGPGWI
jgi:hypothetical protein